MAIFRLSISERTRSFIEPTLLMSSSFSSVSVLPWRISKSRTSSVRNASGPHPNDVISTNSTFFLPALHLAASSIRLG